MRRYATVEQLAEMLGPGVPVPADAEQLLDLASEVIDELLIAARYATTPEGMPADPAVADAMARATCAQALYIDESGDRTGASRQWTSATLGPASYTRAPGGTLGPGGLSLEYAPRAVRILRVAGLLDARVHVRG